MTGTKISGAEYALRKIFSNDFVFEVPRYQRPYSWTTEQAGELLDDVLKSIEDGTTPVDQLDPYFLGSLVLIKGETSADADVVDGQQRLTTLTILFAVLAHLAEDPDERDSIWSYVAAKGNKIEQIPDRPRLTLRPRDREWFEAYVQTRDAIPSLLALDSGPLTDPQRNVLANAKLFRDALQAMDQQELRRISSFLALNCYLVAVSTPSLDSAYRIFSVLNERGLDLSHADILKAEVIGKLAESDQDVYTAKWEDAEEALGRENFDALFAHIRMAFVKRKIRETTLKEFRAFVVEPEPDARVIIDAVIEPYADAYRTVLDAAFETDGDDKSINQRLRWLAMIDNADWVPPALHFIVRNPNDPVAILNFLTRLDRLASSMHIRSVHLNPRLERYGKLLDAIDDGEDLYAQGSPLMLTAEEVAATRAALDGALYTNGPAKFVLLRLDEQMSSGGVTYDYPLISVEHVLPQGMEEAWAALFTPEEHASWVHRLGNLVLLTRRKNSQAQNYEFDKKKKKYFMSSGGVSPFAITTEISHEPEWTIETLERRQAQAMAKLVALWDLA